MLITWLFAQSDDATLIKQQGTVVNHRSTDRVNRTADQCNWFFLRCTRNLGISQQAGRRYSQDQGGQDTPGNVANKEVHDNKPSGSESVNLEF